MFGGLLPGTASCCVVSIRRQETLPHIFFLLPGVFVVVQFYPWFIFCFSLFYSHYHTLPYEKTKENTN